MNEKIGRPTVLPSSSAKDLMWVLIFCGVTLMIFNVIECDNSSAVIGNLNSIVLASDWSTGIT